MKKQSDKDMVEFDDGWYMTREEYDETIRLLTKFDELFTKAAGEGKFDDLETITLGKEEENE
jgi:hypothetical protein